MWIALVPALRAQRALRRMNDLERRLLVATTSGHQWLRDDRFHKAEAAFAEALRCFDALAGDHTEDRRLERAELVAAWAAALQELDRWDDAEPSLTKALASIESQALGKTTASGVVAAMLHLALGRTGLARRQAVQALPHLETALELLRNSGPTNSLDQSLARSDARLFDKNNLAVRRNASDAFTDNQAVNVFSSLVSINGF